MESPINFTPLKEQLAGDLFTDSLHLAIYSTDASVYREKPLAVAYPKNKEDVQKIVQFANENNCPIIPRASGTSLAGQVVGSGLVVDCTKYMNKIIEVDEENSTVTIEPGVVLDELNQHLAQFGLFFGPETSTSTHCSLGGMFGNNSCGTHSIIYGSVRDHILEAHVVLANGEFAHIKELTPDNANALQATESEQNRISKDLINLLQVKENQQLIHEKYPPASVIRRNTGYALDALLHTELFEPSDLPEEPNPNFNVCKLLAGSEGTLAFTTSMVLHVDPLPPIHKAVVCLQHDTIAECCKANLVALRHQPKAVELMDDIILKLARQNPIQLEQSQFIQGTPRAILLVEFMRDSRTELEQQISAFLVDILPQKISHHYSILYDDQVKTVWNLRKAGLGVLGNMVGDRKPVALIEDTAVDPVVLPDYISEFEDLMTKYDNECVFYAHISAGELHLRPILNLKDEGDRILFRKIGQESAELVAKYNGSISGEHGDGRLRGEFIEIQYGPEVLNLFQQVKQIFDPKNIFNPQKIVNTAPMDQFLRYEANQQTKEFETIFDFSKEMGILRATEKCNGVGYCRKSPAIGGTMCPSFQATRNEKDSTRARANTLREVLTNSTDKNPFESQEIYDALDLCLSCKACKSECPSTIDMAKLKAEAMYQRYKTEPIPRRSKQIANSPVLIGKYQKFASAINWVSKQNFVKKAMGIAQQRSLPEVKKETVSQWVSKRNVGHRERVVYLFNDEFTNFYDVEIGQKAIELLEALNYEVKLVDHLLSGRTYLSKAFLDEAKGIAQNNIAKLGPLISESTPLIGIEPSAILTFRDEYIDLLRDEEKQQALELAKNVYLIEEFLAREIKAGYIKEDRFLTGQPEQLVKLHGHCQQKAMVGNKVIVDCLSVIPNITVEVIPSGCCGMAGSFGYEEEHYDLSMQIGELVLFPEVRQTDQATIIVAPGTSCRHQIKDGTSREALHPIEVLWQYVKK